ncbi:MAG: hypothetical protein C0392_07235 [Syntrophus sp. (in: bacteria)]|nr:hypothetical protein [Syntrophus sp. (in: bacteria)]
MSILFIQNWDIIQGKEDEYAHYISEVYLPEITSMGFIPVGAFYVEVGFGPRMLAINTANDLEDLSKMVGSQKFKEMTVDLKRLVYNYRRTVLEPTGAVKRGKYTVQKGVWKLNQYYDIRPGMKKAYADYIIQEHLPVLEKIDYLEVTGGWNTVYGGFSEIIAELTFKDPVDIGRLLNNEDFRRITLKLKNEFAYNYMSRILRCTERFDEPRWFRL